MSYLDLLNADGSVNVAAYEKILDSRVTHEVNLRRCNEARLYAPKHVGLGEAAVWYALIADNMHLPPLPAGEVERIRRQQRDALDLWVGAMAAAAAKQRASMRRAALRVVA